MKVYLVPNPKKKQALDVIRNAGVILAADGVEMIVDEANAGLSGGVIPATVLPEEAAVAACDIVLTIGGDGTMLHAARAVMQHSKPLLGINIGRLGFLTLIESDELEKLRLLSKGAYSVDARGVLCAETKGVSAGYALNDIVLFKQYPEKTISLNIYCDDILVSRFRGDGVIFATPTGSTAYSMSAGGPILDAALGGIVVSQICAHIVQTPPLVFSGSRVLKTASCGTEEEPVHISCDGVFSHQLLAGDEVTITQSDKTVPLVQFNGLEQLESIDKKLKGR